MAGALRFVPWLLIAAAADPAIAQSQLPRLKLQSVDASRSQPRPELQRAPVIGPRFFEDDRETSPSWTIPLGPRAGERDRRGLSFTLRPGREVKATARLRF